MAAARYICTCGEPIVGEEKKAKCSECLRSIHLACAVLGRCIGGERVVCEHCYRRDPPPPPSTTRRSASSSTRAQLLLDLQRLEEEKCLQEKAAEEKVRRDREYLAKKYELMQADLLANSEASSRRSVSSIAKVQAWLLDKPTDNVESGIGQSEIPAGVSSRTGTVYKPNRLVPTTVAASSTPKSGQHAEHSFGLNPSQPLSQDASRCVVPPENQTQNPLDWSLTWEHPDEPIPKRRIAVDLEEIQRKFGGVQLRPPNPSQHPVGRALPASEPVLGEAQQNPIHWVSSQQQEIPTTSPALASSMGQIQAALALEPLTTRYQQTSGLESAPTGQEASAAITSLAARHIVPKELPNFSGDSVEWPLFLSCYQNTTHLCGFSHGENLMRLQRSLKGNALEAVRSLLLEPSSVPMILSTLHTLYGRPDLVINSLLQKVRSTPAPKPDKLESLISFGLACQNLCGHLRAAGQHAHFSNPALLQELVSKLPANIKLDWALFKQKCPVVDLGTFGDYMAQLVVAASDVAPYQPSQEASVGLNKRKEKEKLYVNTHASGNSMDNVGKRNPPSNPGGKQNQPKPCPICGKQGHKVRDCDDFKKCNLEERWMRVQQHYLCRRCLVAHGKFPCKATLCGMEGCDERHHKLLHPGKPQPVVPAKQVTATETVSVHTALKVSTLFRIVPVTLYSNERSVHTFAFLDEGSSSTLVDVRIAQELGVKGEVHPLYLQWTSDVERCEDNSQLIRLEISGRGAKKRYVVAAAHTVNQLCLPQQSLPFDELAQQFPHLRGLPIQEYRNAIPTILIGLDNTHLKIPLKVQEGRVGQPAAAKTRLGWTVYGPIPGESSSTQQCQFHLYKEAQNPDDVLHDLVKEFFSVEHVGVAVAPLLEGSDEMRSRKILEETTLRLPSGRFQTGLLWKYDHIHFPDSKPMAESRLKSLARRLRRKPELFENLQQQIVEYVKKGYAHKITQEEVLGSDPKKVWYLPLGVVVHPKKPGKVRIVWDAAASVQGQSLNSALLPGPDLLSSLPSVLSKYRQRQVAICGDIKEMFHQFQIRPEDRQAQRFLFRSDPSKAPDIYVMDVATFGVTCSPSAAQFIKNQNAKDFESEFPEAAAAIVHNHYVDDYLDSRDTVDEAAQLALQVKTVHAKAGFHIRNWMSNSEEVLSRVGDSAEESAKNFKTHSTAVSERVLGMSWFPESDEFGFRGLFREQLMPLLYGDVVPTKRQLLQVVMSIFDPLGLVSLAVVHGKILVQKAWRAKIGWDDKISEDLLELWRRWIELLRQLDTVRIPRCYFPSYLPESYESLQLHIFVDASEEAYVATAFFRIVDQSQVRCSLVSSKTKVAPLKLLSVPRLELQAALLGARLAESVAENHSLRIKQRFFWSDSSTVLSWLRSDHRRYRQFVAYRVSEILDTSRVDEWHYVPSHLNVADDATKWKERLQISNSHRWFSGPDFLYDPPKQWPKQEVQSTTTTEELRPMHVHRELRKEQVVQFSRFSKWERCLRAVAYVHRFVDQLKRKRNKEESDVTDILTREELQRAEQTVIKQAQFEAFGDEVITMQNNQTLPVDQRQRLESSSKLYKLSPFLDNQGVVRMEGRIDGFSDATFDFKYPTVLPKNHYVTQLIVDSYHRRYKHSNGETAVNEMRQKYHLTEMRAAFRKVSKTCIWCKVYKATPAVPRMAPLPEARVTPRIRPFSFVGLDYFGPLLVVQGRREVKRWVALFTCLTIRAIHLEVVTSLSAECCKMALRRFIARRGAPSEIYSDQGTNFVGVSGELREQVRAVNQELASTFTNTVTQWRFNPPAAPHMGGSWERMVRSVKCALASLSVERKPNEEVLGTLLVEAESMVNSRPLTYMPLQTSEHAALTPNCFLMLSTSGVNQPPTQLVDDRQTLYTSWFLCQRLLDQFWTRWVKEYLPTITRRTKWFVDTKPVSAGDLVVIVDDRVRNGWIRGQVLRVFPGRDGRCRSANVQTATGVLRRPVAKLAVLDVAGNAREDTEQYGSGNVQDGTLSTE
ncbi:uncharacterized protein LOC134286450 [Aedes albopictus]|uniref:Endonuclease n=1 Tax=Aedes albopictus TaxID=7160 RepID=A0ABM1ZBS0_AEDAL